MNLRWLLWLITVSLIAVALPLLGMAFPQLEVLRGFVYSWVFVLFAWVLVIFYPR